MADYHMTPTAIDETELEFLLDMEILESKIEAATQRQRESRKGTRKMYIDDLL